MANTHLNFNPQTNYCNSEMLVDNSSLCNLFTGKEGYTIIDTRHCENSVSDFIVHHPGKRDVVIFGASTTEQPFKALDSYKETLTVLECHGIIILSGTRQTIGLEVTKPGYVLVSVSTDDLNGIFDVVTELGMLIDISGSYDY